MVLVFDDGGRDFETQQTLRLGNPAKAENVVLNHRNKVPSNKNQQTESLSQMMEITSKPNGRWNSGVEFHFERKCSEL